MTQLTNDYIQPIESEGFICILIRLQEENNVNVATILGASPSGMTQKIALIQKSLLYRLDMDPVVCIETIKDFPTISW